VAPTRSVDAEDGEVAGMLLVARQVVVRAGRRERAGNRELGIDGVVCLSVNDAFVMYQWARSKGIERVFMLPDPGSTNIRRIRPSSTCME
jgi:hypothetical protein